MEKISFIKSIKSSNLQKNNLTLNLIFQDIEKINIIVKFFQNPQLQNISNFLENRYFHSKKFFTIKYIIEIIIYSILILYYI